MKLIAFLVILALAIAVPVMAAGQGTGNQGTDTTDNQGAMDDQDKGNMPDDTAKPELYGEQGGPQAKNVEQIQQQIQEKQQTMQQEMEGMGKKEQAVYQNQNRVREAVHALQQLGPMMGGIGSQVSEVAQHFDNSVQSTIQLETKLQEKSGFARFFSGGDAETGKALQGEVNQNREQLQKLQQVQENCDCDEAVKTMLQEQIQNMEQEQERLQMLAEQEQNKKGLLGWIWK